MLLGRQEVMKWQEVCKCIAKGAEEEKAMLMDEIRSLQDEKEKLTITADSQADQVKKAKEEAQIKAEEAAAKAAEERVAAKAAEDAAAAAPAQVYIVQGTPEAEACDLDFDLVMNPSLAKNEYPAEELETQRAAEHTSLCAQFATPEIWEQYKDKVSSGPAKWTLARAINTGVMYPSSFVGCHAGDSSSYDDFKDFFYPVIQAYHKGFDIEKTKHVTDMDPGKISTALSESAKEKIISTRIRLARNLAMFPLNPGASKDTRPAICDMMEKNRSRRITCMNYPSLHNLKTKLIF